MAKLIEFKKPDQATSPPNAAPPDQPPAPNPVTTAPSPVSPQHKTPAATTDTVPEQPLRTSAPNPNRRTFTTEQDLMATRLINPHNAKLTPEEIAAVEREGVERVSIVINALREHSEQGKGGGSPNYTLGIAIKNKHRIVFMRYPVQGRLQDHLPYALETAVLRTPGIANLELVTPHKELWDTANYTEGTVQRLRDFGCRLRPTHPQPHDLANLLCKMAASNILTPKGLDYHIYTGSITDGLRAYTAAILWGNRHANYYLQVHPTTDLAVAETKASEWAFKLIEPTSSIMVIAANPELGAVWEGSPKIREHLAKSMTTSAQVIRDRQIRIKQDSEPYHYQLAKAARQMAANLYASTTADFRQEKLRPQKKKKAKA